MDLKFTEHDGRHVADIELFALSTCPYCNETKEFLNENGIQYRYINVDQVPESESAEVVKEVDKYNPDETFPTIVINGGKEVIIGFDKPKLEQLIAA